jgi:hypothetical protein
MLDYKKDPGKGEMQSFLILYCCESILAIVIFPSQNNNIVQCVFGVLRPCGNWKFLAVRQVSLMTHGEC